MLTILTIPSGQFARARNAALKVGLPFEALNANQAEITFEDANKVLAIVKESGGRVSKPFTRKMTRAEML